MFNYDYLEDQLDAVSNVRVRFGFDRTIRPGSRPTRMKLRGHRNYVG